MTSDLYHRIKELRLKMKISQEQAAHHLGITRPTYMQIESGNRDITVVELEKLAKFFGVSFEQLCSGKKEQNITVTLEEEPHMPASEEEIRINVPQKNVKKFKEVLLYVLEKAGALPHVGETVLYKLLYFIDFDYYEKFEEQIIGATYIKNRHGPTPIEFKKIVDTMIASGEIDQVKSKYFKYEQKKYLPIREPDLTVLSARELEHINEVIARLSNKNATELSNYSHDDVPWITAEDGKPIEYEAVFYRTPKTSVRNYND